MIVPAPAADTMVLPTATVPTHCSHDNAAVVNGCCQLTSLEQLKEPGRNTCPCFTNCETALRDRLNAWGQ